MSTSPAEDALTTLTAALEAEPSLLDSFRIHWRVAAGDVGPSDLPAHLHEAADQLAQAFGALARTDREPAPLGELAAGASGALLVAWCAASTYRSDVALAPLLAQARAAGLADQVASIACDRVVEGPLRDALACAPLVGEGADLTMLMTPEVRARLEILFWEAGASALEVPSLGPWIWGTPEVFDTMIHTPARGALRGRVTAARCLEVTALGMPPDTHPQIIGRTLQVLQPLLFHPEPLVWIHAARALGRLTGPVEQLQGTLLDWVQGDSPILRQRAITAFASLPAERFGFLAGHLSSIIRDKNAEPLMLAAVAAATPYLFFERKDLWDRLTPRILGGDGGAISARALARGLATLHRRGEKHETIETTLRALREMARRARPATLDESRRWIEVIAVTDVIDGAERDPLDLELGIENLVRIAAQYDDEEADARAARFAGSLASTFQEARRIALGGGSVRHRAAGTNALEGCARAFALRLWGPLLGTRPGGDPVEEPDLRDTWKAIAVAPAEILDLVRERRHAAAAERAELSITSQVNALEAELPLEILAVRLGGYALDACGEDSDLGPGRGPTAHDTCLWLRKIEGLAGGTRELPPSLASALSTLFWRLVDSTQGTALGEVDDVEWLGPFAAWWALVIDRPAVLLQLAAALPMMAPQALAECAEKAEALRAAVASEEPNGAWGAAAAEAFAALHAGDTELAQAVGGLAHALERFAVASGRRADLDSLCFDLVLAANRLQGALANPVLALHAAEESPSIEIEFSMAEHQIADDNPSDRAALAINAPRVATLVSRAIRARETSLLDVWFASLGPIVSALLEAAVQAAIRRTPPPPPQPKKKVPEQIAGYELVKPLGEGGIGRVWLVRKPGADRLFVLKIPKADALATATEDERTAILASFVEEAKALAGLYHPNVANIIDRGVAGDAPFLVLEYLIGADLAQYSRAQLMSLFELRQVVLETCAGLSALHGAGLVHRDIKPANIWLRLPLAGGERFDPEKHRNPAQTPPLTTVVIDFGMVRATKVAADAGGRFVAGTPGYMAPEQVLDPVELDPRADVYAVAATICYVTTGRAFFDDIKNERDRIIAHMRQDPLEDSSRVRGFPAATIKVLRAATARHAKDRPFPLEFAREFAASL